MIPNILAYLKIGGVVLALSGIVFAGYKVREYHLNAIDEAVNTAKLELAVETQKAVDKRERELNEKARLEREGDVCGAGRFRLCVCRSGWISVE